MAKSQNKTCLSILRSILGPVTGGEARFAKTIGRSRSWVKKASAGIIPLSEDAAVRISHETGVSTYWLFANDPTIHPVCLTEDIGMFETEVENLEDHPFVFRFGGLRAGYKQSKGRPFTREAYDQRRMSLQAGLEQTGSRDTLPASIFCLIRDAIHAEKVNKLFLFSFKLDEFLASLEDEFGPPGQVDDNVVRVALEVVDIAEAFASTNSQNNKKTVEKLKPQKKQPSRKKRPA